MPCPGANTAFYGGVFPVVEIVHTQGPPDAVTGQIGPSLVNLHALLGFGDPGTLNAQSICSGQTLTGAAPYTPGVVGTVTHSLFQYGPCTLTQFNFVGGDGSVLDLLPGFGGNTNYTVDANPPTYDFTIVDQEIYQQFFGEVEDWGPMLSASYTSFSGSSPPCFRPRPSVDASNLIKAINGCADHGPFWVFDVYPVGSSYITAGAGWANPFGLDPYGADGFDQVDASGYSSMPLWAPYGIYPCGEGPWGFTVCVGGQAAREVEPDYATFIVSTPPESDPELTATILAGGEDFIAFSLADLEARKDAKLEGPPGSTRPSSETRW